MLVYVIRIYHPPINIIWISFYMALQAFAESLIGPSGYALIGDLLPMQLRSLATGLWMMTLGIAGLIASSISNIAFESTLKYTHTGFQSYQKIFSFIFILGLIALLSVTLIQLSDAHIYCAKSQPSY